MEESPASGITGMRTSKIYFPWVYQVENHPMNLVFDPFDFSARIAIFFDAPLPRPTFIGPATINFCPDGGRPARSHALAPCCNSLGDVL